ncbi:MAG: LysM peptidoglycan-binding domain-containing protein [Bacillota bacterium]
MARFPPDCPEGFLGRYFVIPGDTMSVIAKRFGAGTQQLSAANPHIADPNVLFPGDVLCVPGFRRPVACPPGFGSRLEVVPGDTMFSIARMFNVTVEALIAANPHIPDPEVLFPFDILCVP